MTREEKEMALKVITRLRGYLREADHFFEVFSAIDVSEEEAVDNVLRLTMSWCGYDPPIGRDASPAR